MASAPVILRGEPALGQPLSGYRQFKDFSESAALSGDDRK
jgi:hypothetical protein